jgi:predicted RNase H-like HicB family nuclease
VEAAVEEGDRVRLEAGYGRQGSNEEQISDRLRKIKYGVGAYAPDLPGLGAAGKTLDEVKELIREAVEFHLEGMRSHGDPIPAPSALTEYITI